MTLELSTFHFGQTSCRQVCLKVYYSLNLVVKPHETSERWKIQFQKQKKISKFLKKTPHYIVSFLESCSPKAELSPRSLQTAETETFATIVNGFYPQTIAAEHSILNFCWGSGFLSTTDCDLKKNLQQGLQPFTSTKNNLQYSLQFPRWSKERTAWKVLVFGVSLVFSWISRVTRSICPYSVQMRKNTDQKDSECGHVLHSEVREAFFAEYLRAPASAVSQTADMERFATRVKEILSLNYCCRALYLINLRGYHSILACKFI